MVILVGYLVARQDKRADWLFLSYPKINLRTEGGTGTTNQGRGLLID